MYEADREHLELDSMDTGLLQRQFAKMGARLKVFDDLPRARAKLRGSDFAVDIRRDARGPYYDLTLQVGAGVEPEVVDLQPRMRHLLLMVRHPGHWRDNRHKFLCGHDERDWFAAAVPEQGGASTVLTAMEALKPQEVLQAQARQHLDQRDRNRRHNRAFVRQGEWFFIPAPNLVVNPRLVLVNEPLVRGRGKPHRAEIAYRTGGVLVYFSRRYPRGLPEAEYKELLANDRYARSTTWRAMRRDMTLYVRGWVRHPDHKTIHLDGWHQVVPNTENRAAGMWYLEFLD